ncbi:glycosyl hydrolase family 18 protein [Yersinia proxima]|uniref:glycosyl hydrolase family 18 protein n=1 Tax=Yersinia proxima TaxID=2890316 RepID=UPI001D12DFFA|nr:glycosyl hydrolase family 18 protein [Yersinia proxima]
MKDNIVMGFWHNWPTESGNGYKGGSFKEMDLTSIPLNYNVIVVAFMKVIDGSNDHIPDFRPYKYTDIEFRRQIDTLHSQGRKVLISLGGADADIVMHNGDEVALAERIKQLSDKFGFDGLDVDLEQKAITAGNNQKVIPAALRMVKDHYKLQGKNFIISMAPEFPYLQKGREYEEYIINLEGYYDFIAPQFYNQGGDGVWVDNIGWLAQDNNQNKADFLYYLSESIVTGTRNFIKIPSNKFIIGLPSNNDAAATGYVINAEDVKETFSRLQSAGLPIRGLMTWSVNWDAGTNSAGKDYNWEFINRFGYLTENDVVPELVENNWIANVRYEDGDRVLWNGIVYSCVMRHESNIYWTPENAASLWNIGSH